MFLLYFLKNVFLINRHLLQLIFFFQRPSNIIKSNLMSIHEQNTKCCLVLEYTIIYILPKKKYDQSHQHQYEENGGRILLPF